MAFTYRVLTSSVASDAPLSSLRLMVERAKAVLPTASRLKMVLHFILTVY